MVPMGCWSQTQPANTVNDTGHIKDNCIWLNNKIACEMQAQEQVTVRPYQKEYQDSHSKKKKKIAPQILDQSEGGKVCGPELRDKPNNDSRI